MLNRLLAVLALFIAVAAYQFGYYQGRLSLSSDGLERTGKPQASTVITAGRQAALPPVSERCAGNTPPPLEQAISSPVTGSVAVE